MCVWLVSEENFFSLHNKLIFSLRRTYIPSLALHISLFDVFLVVPGRPLVIKNNNIVHFYTNLHYFMFYSSLVARSSSPSPLKPLAILQ